MRLAGMRLAGMRLAGIFKGGASEAGTDKPHRRGFYLFVYLSIYLFVQVSSVRLIGGFALKAKTPPAQSGQWRKPSVLIKRQFMLRRMSRPAGQI